MDRLFSIFHRWPINRKLSLVVLGISGLLIGAMTIAVSVEKFFSYREKLVSNSSVLAEVIGANSTAALLFEDRNTALEMLAALQAEKDVVAAALYNDDGGVFATYTRSSLPLMDGGTELPANIPAMAETMSVDIHRNYLDISRRIVLGGETAGFIVLRTDLSRLKESLQRFVVLITAFSVVLLAGGMVICMRLNRLITRPVSDLAATMQYVTRTRRYGERVEKSHDDEIGILVDGFNAMLDTVQKHEGELEEHRHSLEDLVTVRTRELQEANRKLLAEIKEREEVQAKLAQAEKMEAIGTLAGGVAHDLNNILSGIVTYPDLLLLNLPEDSKLRGPIETIRASGKKAAAIVNDLLTLARRGVKIDEQVDMGQLVRSYLESPEFRELLESHPAVAIDLQEKEPMLVVRGSSVHLGKTVMNLVTNGIEAMVGGGTLRLVLDRVVLSNRPPGFQRWRAGEYVRMVVADSGVGIAQNDLQRIFEPFYSRKVMGKSGTGLGMAVVWGAVEDHQGHIVVESKEKEGTTFTLYFPAETQTAAAPSVKKETDQIPMGAGQSLLVVDDSPEQRQIVLKMLDYLGYRAEAVASGEEAIDYLQQQSVDLVILDMLMAPGIDGLETYKRILAFRPDQKALIASGFSQPANIVEAQRLGVCAYIMKPYTVVRLGKALHDAFAGE